MEQLNKIISELFGLSVEALTDEISMQQTAKWDSLTHMKLIAGIEESFNIELEMDDIMDMTTVGAIRSILESRYHVS